MRECIKLRRKMEGKHESEDGISRVLVDQLHRAGFFFA